MRTPAGPAACLALLAPPLQAAELPIFDAHVHYSHDAWDVLPPQDAVALLRQAGLKRALVSSSDDDGTQRLLAEAPDLIVPVAAALPHARRDRQLGARRQRRRASSRSG